MARLSPIEIIVDIQPVAYETFQIVLVQLKTTTFISVAQVAFSVYNGFYTPWSYVTWIGVEYHFNSFFVHLDFSHCLVM